LGRKTEFEDDFHKDARARQRQYYERKSQKQSLKPFIFSVFCIILSFAFLTNGFGLFHKFLVVEDSSMYGVLHVNDVVWSCRILPSNLTGSLVTFYADGVGYLTHRTIEDNGSLIVTKGDSNPSADRAISKSEVYGVCVAVLPFYSNYLNAAGFMLFFSVGTFITCYFLVFPKKSQVSNYEKQEGGMKKCE